MGQYYFPLMIGEDETGEQVLSRAYSHDFDSGLKLMEHSWIGNKFVNAVLGELYCDAKRLAWIGDYATDVVDTNTVFSDNFIRGKRAFKKWYDIAMRGVDDIKTISPDSVSPYDLNMENQYGFIINETKGVFLDFERYIETSKCGNGKEVWCVNPIPLLTCIGNGQGGGDYSGKSMDLVGSWAFDKLRVTDIRPAIYKEFDPPVFVERNDFDIYEGVPFS